MGTYEINLATDEMITSQRFQHIWGVKNTKNRSAFAALIHPEDLPIREKAFQQAFKTTELLYEARLVLDKQTKWVRVSGKILFDDQ
ncbi:MAG: hypothetical protein NVS1B13_09120 [Flavisolibacter sp.]